MNGVHIITSVELVNFFALYAKSNNMGFVCSPHFRVVKGPTILKYLK